MRKKILWQIYWKQFKTFIEFSVIKKWNFKTTEKTFKGNEDYGNGWKIQSMNATEYF